jgi:hypothetical protein
MTIPSAGVLPVRTSQYVRFVAWAFDRRGLALRRCRLGRRPPRGLLSSGLRKKWIEEGDREHCGDERTHEASIVFRCARSR